MNFVGKALKPAAVLASAVLMLSLSGCYDQREIDDLAYPVAVGLDVGAADSLRMTLLLASPLTIGGGGGGESGGGGGGGGDTESETTPIITVDTPSIYSGLDLINNIISKEINLSHAKVIVISKELAQKGINEYIQAIQRNREFRPNTFVMVSNDPPDEYLRNTKPVLESNPAKYYELLLGKDYASFYPDVRISEFHNADISDSIEPVAILTGINRKESVDQLGEDIKSTGSGRPKGVYEAGNIPVISKLKNVVMGIAAFKNGKMAGTLNGTEATCYQMVTGKYKHSYWSFPDAYDESKLVVMDIIQRNKPSIKAQIRDGKVEVSIVLDLEGDFTSIQSNTAYEDHPQPMEEKASEIIGNEVAAMLRKTTDELDSDICGIGRYVKRRFRTLDEWKSFDWNEIYKSTKFDIKVKLKVRRTGLVIKSEHQM
jgi:spore germination protein KC